MIFPKLHIQLERWRWNDECQSYVSNMGNIRDKKKERRSIHLTKDGGYPCFNITIEGARKHIMVHRAVASTWCKRPKNKAACTVDHINMNKRDNRAVNLEWVTEEENCLRAKEAEEVVITKLEKAKMAAQTGVITQLKWEEVCRDKSKYLMTDSQTLKWVSIDECARQLRARLPKNPEPPEGYETILVRKALNKTKYFSLSWYLMRKEDYSLV